VPTPFDRTLDRCWRVALRAAYLGARAWWAVRRPEVRSAFVAVWWNDQLLLIRNSYKPGETVPCGGLRAGESARAGARRELAEEVGLCVGEDALQPAFRAVVEHHSTRDHFEVFELWCDERPAIQVDGREVVSSEFCPRHALGERPLVPQVRAYLAARDDQPGTRQGR
jgi:ADP-ribose pyrophosphatase YjhB (NUDIX family)